MSWLLGSLAALFAPYAGVCLFLFRRQRRLMYRPDPERLDPRRAGPDWCRVETTTADGLRLAHLHRPAAPGRASLVLFHGNAGHAGHRTAKFDFLLDRGVGVFLCEYRGFGGNPGAPSEPGLLADARAALAWLEGQGLPPERLLLYGESLGSGVATALAAELARAGRPAAGLVLEAPFTSMAAAAQRHYPWLPARWLVRDRYDSLARIAAVGAPLLILHGEADRTVPLAFGRCLHAAAAEPKRLVALPGLGHVDHLARPEARAALVDFLRARTPALDATA